MRTVRGHGIIVDRTRIHAAKVIMNAAVGAGDDGSMWGTRFVIACGWVAAPLVNAAVLRHIVFTHVHGGGIIIDCCRVFAAVGGDRSRQRWRWRRPCRYVHGCSAVPTLFLVARHEHMTRQRPSTFLYVAAWRRACRARAPSFCSADPVQRSAEAASFFFQPA